MPQIRPSPHEIKGHLYYHPERGQRYSGLDPYWTVADLLINHFDGYAEIDSEIDGERITISLNYSKSGFAPRDQDDVQERLYEFELHIEGDGERKCHFNISPRFPQIEHYETGEQISVPFDHLDADRGVTVQFQSSNIDIDDIPSLLPRALSELADSAESGFDIRYFRQPQAGRIEECERYVRLLRDWNKKLIKTGGLFDRLAMLLSSEKGTKGKHTWDNTEEIGYHHQVQLSSTGAGQLLPMHSRGKQLKSYLPQNPDNFDENDALYHPKFGVLFRKSLNTNSVRWKDRHDLIDELDETIINALEWADIPVDVSNDSADNSNSVFVADDHFSVNPRDESLPVSENPLPRLEAEQDHLLMTVLRDMTGSDTDIVETVATDGGQDVDDLAEASGYSLSTIYRALERLDGVLENRNGHVRFVSEKIAEEVRGIVQSAEHAIESAADRAASLLDVEINQSSNSAVSRWLAEYGAEFIPPNGDRDKPKIRIDTLMAELKSRPQPYLPDVLDYLVHAWLTDGRRRADVEDIIIDVQVAGGEHYHSPLRVIR